MTTPMRRRDQRGAVLFISLIFLVVLMLAGVALVRSVYTSNVIAGNLAFKQSATHSADLGVEAAIAFLEANSAGTTLYFDRLSTGTRYVSRRQDPAAGESWDAFWNATLASSGAVNSLPTDAAGNQVSYVIHRLCNSGGAPVYPGCSSAAVDIASEGDSKCSNCVKLNSTRQIYYRITARVAGPRNTLSYVQVVVAI